MGLLLGWLLVVLILYKSPVKWAWLLFALLYYRRRKGGSEKLNGSLKVGSQRMTERGVEAQSVMPPHSTAALVPHHCTHSGPVPTPEHPPPQACPLAV
jgi:hypothetical protein